uniref:Nucleoside phosphorylase domain-containing protein n=1 Tax=Odontella aurita TaxID=265563 RepID=A0A7S4ID08_9STRA
MRRVVIIYAMEEEFMPFVRDHGLAPVKPSPFSPGAPMVAYRGEVSNGAIDAVAVWCGRDRRFRSNSVGTVAAGVACYAAVEAFGPDLVISAGTAGGFGELGARTGDVYLSTKCIFHARRIPENFGGNTYEEYGFGHFRSPPAITSLAARASVKLGVVSTSDSLDCSPRDLQLLRSEGAVVKEMEAAAVASVAQWLGVPFVALKAVTDIVDGPESTAAEFYTNLAVASDALRDRLTDLLGLIAAVPAFDGMGAMPEAAEPCPPGNTSNAQSPKPPRHAEPTSRWKFAAVCRVVAEFGLVAILVASLQRR